MYINFFSINRKQKFANNETRKKKEEEFKFPQYNTEIKLSLNQRSKEKYWITFDIISFTHIWNENNAALLEGALKVDEKTIFTIEIKEKNELTVRCSIAIIKWSKREIFQNKIDANDVNEVLVTIMFPEHHSNLLFFISVQCN